MARRAAGVAAMLGGLALLAGCQTVRTTQGGVVGVDRQQTMLVSSDTINRSAAQEYQKVIAEAQRKNALDRDAQQAERVRRIAERLIPTTAVFRSDAPGWRWEVHVLSSNEVNAWCMPGGKIAVYTGLISKLNITDDELAAVMGHEIAHALREHGREQYSKAVAQQVGLSVVGVLLGAGQAATDLSQKAFDLFVNLPNSREDETEADRIGVELAARAGFDPRAALTLWQKMSRSGGGEPPQILSTHPSSATRQQDLQVYAERVMPLYEATRKR
jgi:predicted Zn-dependent protease